jgi:hypothetical protein
MKVFVLYYYGHVDCYKRADSYGGIVGIFYKEEEAYKNAVFELKNMLNERARYNWDEIDLEHNIHTIDKLWEEKGHLQCEYCGRTITKECILDLNDEDNLFTKEHIVSILDNDNISYKDKYLFIKDNLYDILNKPEFTMQPTHTNYTVEEFEII